MVPLSSMVSLLLLLIQLEAISMRSLPIVDITEVTQLDRSNRTCEQEDIYRVKGKELGEVLSKFGFCYVLGHGVDRQLINDSFTAAKNFFLNHSDIYEQFPRRKGSLLGFANGESQKFFFERPPDLTKSYDIVKGYPQFEAIPKEEKLSFTKLWSSYQTTGDIIIRLLAAAYPSKYLSEAHNHVGIHEENTSNVRLAYYPRITRPVETNQTRIAEHTDFGTLTMLLQDDVGGLEVVGPDGVFLPVTPVPDTMVLNIGDLLQQASNNYFRSTIHRVVANMNNSRERLSIGFFLHPDRRYVIDSSYGGKTVQDHVNARNNATFAY